MSAGLFMTLASWSESELPIRATTAHKFACEFHPQSGPIRYVGRDGHVDA